MSNKMNTPWIVNPVPWAEGMADIVNASGRTIFAELPIKRAAHIVRCVNSHDQLVEALQEIITKCAAPPNFSNPSIQDVAQAALVAAGEQA